jgi:hypothetical protein
MSLCIRTQNECLILAHHVKNHVTRACKTRWRNLAEDATVNQQPIEDSLSEVDPKLVRRLVPFDRILKRGICQDDVELQQFSLPPNDSPTVPARADFTEATVL